MSDAELTIQNQIRVRAAEHGCYLWRNNNGALYAPAYRGAPARPVRFGLANDSPRASLVLKSSDLVGVASGAAWGFADHGIFASVECKAPGWRYRGTDRETAQLAWINLVRGQGGVALFATKWEDVYAEFARFFAARSDPKARAAIR